MLVAGPGSVVVCHCWPVQAVRAGWPPWASQKTSGPSKPELTGWIAAARAVLPVVPGSSCTAQPWPAWFASASLPCASTKNTPATVAAVLTADSGLFAATPYGEEIEVDCQPWPFSEVTVSVPGAPREKIWIPAVPPPELASASDATSAVRSAGSALVTQLVPCSTVSLSWPAVPK